MRFTSGDGEALVPIGILIACLGVALIMLFFQRQPSGYALDHLCFTSTAEKVHDDVGDTIYLGANAGLEQHLNQGIICSNGTVLPPGGAK